MEEVFNPRSIAVIGASKSIEWFIRPTMESYKGKLHLINPKHDRLYGQKCCSSVLELDGQIDFAALATPARVVPTVLKECIEKGVKAVWVFSAGFSEVGNSELEAEIRDIAEENGIYLVGPNCMGVYCPASGIHIAYGLPKEPGSVGFVSQSGAEAVNFVLNGGGRGIRFSKVVSFGNAAGLDSVDFIRYLGADESTRIIAVYVEGIRRGRELVEVLKKISKTKPVIILKGGMSESGARAALSHTGSMAGSSEIWKTAMKQCNAISVDSFEEMEDTVLAFLKSPLPSAKGIVLVLGSGGVGVVATDELTRATALSVPALNELTERLSEVRPGTSLSNPMDIYMTFADSPSGTVMNIIKEASSLDKIGSIIVQIDPNEFPSYYPIDESSKREREFIEEILKTCRIVRDQLKKPVAIVVASSPYYEKRRQFQLTFQGEGFPVFDSILRAAKALWNLYKYSMRPFTTTPQ